MPVHTNDIWRSSRRCGIRARQWRTGRTRLNPKGFESNMRGKISKAAIERLEESQSLYDPKIRGFVADRTPLELTQLFGCDRVTFAFQYKANGRKRWHDLCIYDVLELSVENARTEAKRVADAIKV